ncbi:hypothetical protein MKW98_012248 [Papaver atlanticum]|uniref:Uncharacterized protein n=1 Tax=Papaver atlanticum TaxID=357466 RepID=A0AAD4T1G9_9MAGN|nr:hypothetical protein MKW98_012248 [Papaver atlanticum]
MNIEAESSSNSSKPLDEGTSDYSDKTLERLYEGKNFELWKIAKDKLALPLLIDLCLKTGFCLCFFRVEVSFFDNELWKQKVVEEFDQSDIDRNKKAHWKQTFVVCWGNKKAGISERWILGRELFHRATTLDEYLRGYYKALFRK